MMPTARSEEFVTDYRSKLIERQIKQQIAEFENLKTVEEKQKIELEKVCNSQMKFNAFLHYLNRLIENLTEELTNKHNEKLYSRYGGSILTKQDKDTVINISSIQV